MTQPCEFFKIIPQHGAKGKMHRRRPLDGQKESFRTIPGIIPYPSRNHS